MHVHHVRQTRGAEFATTPRGGPYLLAEEMQITSEQSTEEVVAIGRKNGFFKCPVGGYASLYPRLCPKCGELLVPTDAIDSVTEPRHGRSDRDDALPG